MNPVHSCIVAPSDQGSLVLNIVSFSALDLETIVKLQDEGLVINRMQHDLLNSVRLCNFVDASFQIDCGFVVKDRFDLVLANALVILSDGNHSFIINREFHLLNICRVRYEIVSDVFLDAFNVFPEVNVSILIACSHDVA